MPITEGSISIGRRINTGDYSHKEAKVELHYVVEGGEDFRQLGDTASSEALVQLAKTVATVVKLEDTPEIVVGTLKIGAVEEPKFDKRMVRHRRTKAEMEAARAAEVAMVEQQVGEPTADPTPGDAPVAPAEPVSEPVPAAVEISDKELNIACNEMANRLHAVNKDKEENTRRIKGLIAQFTNGNSATIPQDQRACFLGLLKAL